MKYSIIIPVYNVEKYLEEALDSVNRQTFVDYEAIIINDGSTDNSEDIIDEFVRKNNKFKKINVKNSGLGAARNRGVTEAIGEYLIFFDSDDLLDINLLKDLDNTIQNNSSDLVDVLVYDYSDFESRSTNVLNYHEFPESLEKYGVVAWNKAYRKLFWDKNGFQFPEGIKYEDTPLVHVIMGMSLKTVKISGTSQYFYRQNRKDSIIGESNNGDISQRFNALKVMKQNIETYQEELSDLGKINFVYMKLGKELIYLIIMALKHKASKDELYKLFCMVYSEPIKKATFKLGGIKSKGALIVLRIYFFINYKLLPRDRKKYV